MGHKSTNVRSKTVPRQYPGYKPRVSPWLARVAKVNLGLTAWLGSHLFTQPRHWPRPEREQRLLTTGTPILLRRGVRAWSFGSGPLVLLVHGWEGRGAQLGAFVEPLVARGFRVITFDVQAHGSSPGTHATISSWLEPMFELAERFGDPTGIIAHSFGCPAVSLALRRCLHARSVVYIAPPDALDGGAQTFARVTGIGARGEAALKRRLTAMTGIDFDEQRVVNFGRGMVTPLLVVHDEEDKDVALRSARTYARHWPGCSVFTTAGLGHRQILRDPQVVQHVVSFVFGHRQSAGELDRWFDSALGDRSSFGAPRGAAPDGPPTPG